MNPSTPSIGSVSPTWVWDSPGVPPRLSRVIFRRDLELSGRAAAAVLTLSARTRYRLSVNGTILGGGPARSYPEFREADTCDLTEHLRPGANRIEVEVLHEAFATFHHLAEPPGFIAWGEIVENRGARHDLATPGAWRCRRRSGTDETAPRLSFAQGPVDILDLRAEAEDTPSAWSAPCPAEPGLSPALLPRAIPALTRLARVPPDVRCAVADEAESVHAARVTGDDDAPNPRGRPRAAAARGWLYAPREQSVPLGCWWGDIWIDGVLLDKANDPARPLRQRAGPRLSAGWHRLCAAGEIIFGYWEFCLSWPRAAGLSLRTSPSHDAPEGVEVAGPLPAEAMKAARDDLAAGRETPALVWRAAPAGAAAGTPLRGLAWSVPRAAAAATVLPLDVPAGTPCLIAADMGEIVLASPAIDIETPEGAVVDIGHAEQLAPSGRPDYGKVVTVYAADRFVLPAGRHRLETIAPRGFRHLEVLIHGHAAPATVHALTAVEMRYPYRFTGAFECSDPDFNRLWNYGRRTLELCSEDVLTDCPWRERTLYGGDLLAEMGATAALTRDLRLVRRSLDVLLQSCNPATGWLQSAAPIHRERVSLADYPLLVAIASAWLVRLTDDAAFARRAWPVLRGMAAAASRMRRAGGLYVPPTSAFIDHQRRVTAGPTAAFNAALVAGLRGIAEVGRRAGEAAEATTLDAQAEALESVLPGAFYDEPAAIFRDLPPDGRDRGTEGSPAIVWPLLFAPATRRLAPAALPALRQVLDGFAPDREPQSVSPYQMFYLLALLRALGEAELAENTIRRVYAGMLARPTGTLWEQSQPDKSLTHAWSCAINDYFATAVLGVRLGFEGRDELAPIRVRPCAAALSWARGTVPHPRGDVSVAWRRDGGRLHVTVKAPDGVPVDVAPAGPLAALETVCRER